MKNNFVICLFTLMCLVSFAQDSKQLPPEPEFILEVYAFDKQKIGLVRLEKENSRLETKTKMGGFAGAEYVYNLGGEKSTVRFSSSQVPSFVFRYRGDNATATSYMNNSVLKDTLQKMGSSVEQFNTMLDDVTNPVKTLSLYRLDVRKSGRALVFQSSGGAFSKGKKASDKLSVSFRLIRDGYYEIVVDKPLPKGEYCFLHAAVGLMEPTFFAFGVD